MSADKYDDTPSKIATMKTHGSPLCEWKAELDAPVISATVARINNEDVVLVITTQARSPVFYTITSRGISGSKGTCGLGDASLKEVMTSVCALNGRAFVTTVSSIYELKTDMHKTYRLCKLYHAQGIPWPLRNISAEKCGNIDVLVASFGLQNYDIGSTGLLIVCLHNKTVHTTVLPVSTSDTLPYSLQYDPALTLLYILVVTINSEVLLFCVCFQEPAALGSVLREFEWFTQTGTEFYTSRLIVSNLAEYFPCKNETNNESILQIKAICMCGGSAVIAVSAVDEAGQSLDLSSLLVVSELLSCLSFSIVELDNLNRQVSSIEREPGLFNIHSMSPSLVTTGNLYLSYSKQNRLYLHKISLKNNDSTDDLLVDICEIQPSFHMFYTMYEREGNVSCIFVTIDKMRPFLCLANKQMYTTYRSKVKEEHKKEHKERQKKKIKLSIV